MASPWEVLFAGDDKECVVFPVIHTGRFSSTLIGTLDEASRRGRLRAYLVVQKNHFTVLYNGFSAH